MTHVWKENEMHHLTVFFFSTIPQKNLETIETKLRAFSRNCSGRSMATTILLTTLKVHCQIRFCLVPCFSHPEYYTTLPNYVFFFIVQDTFKVVGLTLTSSLWKQITQTCSYLLTNNCHNLVKLMLSFQKIVVKNCIAFQNHNVKTLQNSARRSALVFLS